MQKLVICLMSILIAGCANFEDRGEILQGHLQRRDCNAAENYARKMAGNDGDRYFGLGVVYVECYRKRKEGVEYLKVAAQSGNKLAIDALIQLGEKPPEPTTRYISVPTPTQQPQQIIIQQQPAVILPGPSRGAIINPTFNPFGR